MSTPSTERMIIEDIREIKDQWERLIAHNDGARHFAQLLVAYLQRQDAITALEADWENTEELAILKGTRVAFKVMRTTLNNSLRKLEEADARRNTGT